MNMFGRKKKESFSPELYEDNEIAYIEEHIERYFGSYEGVFHEIVSPDIHLDIAIVDPTPERDYYTLVTMGVGAHVMNIPEELSKKEFGRTELLIRLPSDWDIKNDKEIWYWPIRWLKIVGRLPIEHDTWLGYGHTIPSGEPFAKNTKFECVMLVEPQNVDENAMECQLPSGDVVNFYQLVPLYEDEMNLKLESDAETLSELLLKVDGLDVVNISRKSALK